MRLSDYRAVLFDLDGVLTNTAEVHERAWARMFTDFLDARRAGGEPVAAYNDADYFDHIDGKPRYEGVRSLLASRGITLPDGTPADGAGQTTVAGLGNRKNEYLLSILRDEGVQAFPGSVLLLDRLEERAMPMAVVSSSRNACAVLTAAGLRDRFEIVVDGVAAATAGLAGKPAPDTYLHAAALLGVPPACTVVVEDAISGVRAGAAGGFRVVGVDRGAGRGELIDNGADVVVGDLAELAVD
jgi:beta-phosphoglucomutase family hydrolase